MNVKIENGQKVRLKSLSGSVPQTGTVFASGINHQKRDKYVNIHMDDGNVIQIVFAAVPKPQTSTPNGDAEEKPTDKGGEQLSIKGQFQSLPPSKSKVNGKAKREPAKV